MRKRQKRKSESSDAGNSSAVDTAPELPAEDQARRAYTAAVRLLGSRDHSVFEITRKLQKREHSPDAIASALQELAELNYVNDARYAQLYTEQRLNRGYGPSSVRSKLHERGVASHLVETALADQTATWAELAQAALERKFDARTICSREKRDEARMARFLASRGFSFGDALRALTEARKTSKN